MFTVKATYRGETRKLTFPHTSSFPSYDELCSQLYRIFPINNDYFLSKLLYSPNADKPARILIAQEVHTQEQYSDAVRPLSGQVNSNALLRFSIHDETPHKQPNQPYSWNMDEYTASRSASGPHSGQARPSSENDGDKRPIVPPKPAELFVHPFEYISALSGRSPSVRSAASLRSVPMDIDSTLSSSSSQPHSQGQASGKARETERSHSGNTSMNSCCSTAEVKEDIKALISGFEKDLNKTLEKGLSSAAAPKVSISVSELKPNDAPVDLGALFSEGSFPSTGPARRGSARVTCSRPGRRHGRVPLQPPGCLNASTSQEGRPSPQTPEEVVHANVLCDNCDKTVVGIRHKCLDCPDYDLCTPCITEQNAAEKHNPFHEFFEIREPGRVIVHTVFEGDRRHRGNSTDNNNRETAAESAPIPVMHNAMCDLCNSAIWGTRYKCCQCPDFDTCASCFQITPEQHPNHSFFKVERSDEIVRRYNGRQRRAHFARCDSCQKTIHGVRYKCMHPECPDFDLCDRCEAMPIPVHPEAHPLLKMKNPDVVVPTVYRVGGTEVVPPYDPHPPHVPQPWATWTPSQAPQFGARYRAAYAPRDGYQPAYIKSQTCMSVPIPKGAIEEQFVQEDERATTPRPIERALSVEEHDSQNPFADPPKIAPINVPESLVSSFNASVEDRMKGVRDQSPLAEALERETSLFEGFLDRARATSEDEEVSMEVEKSKQEEKVPSFVNDVLTDFFKAVDQRKQLAKEVQEQNEVQEVQEEMKEKTPEREEALSTLVSGVSRLVAIVACETPAATPSAEEALTLVEKEEEVASKDAVSEAEETAPEEEPKVVEEPKEEPKEEVLPPLSAGFVMDVTAPDGQVFPPGAEFMKCWRMVNDGTVDWPESTEVVFVAGQPGLVKKVNEVVKVGAVKAGEQVDVWTGELKAPEGVGRYVGYWRLRNGDTQEVFGNSIWAEIEVAEADHMSDESSLSGSSIVMMPTGLGENTVSTATSVRPASLTLTIPSSGSTTTGGGSDIGSDVSLLDDDLSDGEMAAWEDARSRLEGASVAGSAAPAAAPVAPGSPVGEDFELVYDSGSDM